MKIWSKVNIMISGLKIFYSKINNSKCLHQQSNDRRNNDTYTKYMYLTISKRNNKYMNKQYKYLKILLIIATRMCKISTRCYKYDYFNNEINKTLTLHSILKLSNISHLYFNSLCSHTQNDLVSKWGHNYSPPSIQYSTMYLPCPSIGNAWVLYINHLVEFSIHV